MQFPDGPTKASRKLARALQERGAKASLQRTLGCARGLIQHWIAGRRFPDARQAAFLEAHLGIRVAWWLVPSVGS